MTPHVPEDDATTIRYSVKELLGDIKTSIDRLDGKLDTKADRAEVNMLFEKVEHANIEITDIRQEVVEIRQEVEHRKRSDAEITEWKRWITPVILALALLGVGVIQLIKK